MKQKTKKHLIGGAIIIVWLLGCYFIGQATHPKENTAISTVSTDPAPEKADSGETVAAETLEDEKKDDITGEVTVRFFNVKQLSTDEIPWGINAGIISLENGSEAWLLTPGTSLSFESANGAVLECRIHPWMSDVSDGATLVVSSETDSETIEIGSAPQEISTGPGTVGLELLNTEKNDGDWVIIQPKLNGTAKDSERNT